MNQLTVENLTFRYPDGRLALQGVSLSIERGAKVALVGANGSGKTTLLLHLNGILSATEGNITIGEMPLKPDNLAQIRAKVGLVFQNPDDQLFMPTVFEDVAFGPLHMGFPPQEVKKRVEEALEAVGMAGYEARSSQHLSVGEKKRIALATVLSMKPEILVLDEPSAGLDPRARRQLQAFLTNHTDQTLLISTHDMQFAYDLCRQVVVLDAGQVVAAGTSEAILTDHGLMTQHGLEIPPAVRQSGL